MATTTLLTLEQYRERYSGESGYEFYFGEAVRKPMVTRLHGALAVILAKLFHEAGYFSTCEVDLRIDPNWEPRPDVMAEDPDSDLSAPYPTKPVAIVAEILSPSDSMSGVFRKCGDYARVGVAQIFVLDPEERRVWQWSRETKNLERIDQLLLGNGAVLPASRVWIELDRRIPREN
jgi:Uma2 family endonuclease